ncbi:Uncharacterized protein OBRU01_12043, partial [Operophtera brumata]
MPIAMSKDEWSRIIHWTEQGEDPETVRQREYVRYLDTTSTNMTKHWPNSFELRRARIEATEQTNNKFYKRYLKRKKEEQVWLMFSARDINELRRQAAEQKKKEDDGIIQRSKEWHQLVATKKKRRFDDAAEKARILGDMQKARDEAAARRAEQAARDNMDNRLIHVLLKSRARVERQRKQTEQDVKAAKQSVLDKISAKLQSGSAARDAKELAILNKAIKEKDDMFKNIEIFEDFKEGLRKEKERKTKEFREDTLRLWKERDEREARERAETRYFYGELAEKKLRDADNRLLTHAAELVREAHDNGRPSYALHGAVDPTPSKITSKKEREVPEEEYKRCGRANGLQRRKGQVIQL